MSENRAVVNRLYAALVKYDAETMATCYADDAVFSDPVFGELRGEAVRDMWRMLLSRGSGEMTASAVMLGGAADGSTLQMLTTIDYTFSRTGRRVSNRIATFMKFRDGRIVRQVDDFEFYRWARQAFGITGWLGGWTQSFQRKVQAEAAAGLARFQAQR